MPLYLVRWPNLDLALVHAKDEDDLKDILDEVSDPASATWQVYRGPLYIGFKSQIKLGLDEKPRDRPLRPQDITLSGVQEAFESGCFHEPESQQDLTTDSTGEMYRLFLKKAFPKLYRAQEEQNPDVETIDLAACEKAVMAELKPLFGYSKRAHKVYSGDDPASQLLQMAGVVELTPSMQESIQQGLVDSEAKAKVRVVRDVAFAPGERLKDGARARTRGPGGRRRRG